MSARRFRASITPFTAAFCWQILHYTPGDRVGLAGYGHKPRLWLKPKAGRRHITTLAQSCARMSAEFDETNHVLGLHYILAKETRRSLVVVFTDFSDATTAELLVETLAHVVKKHLVLFVAIDDPDLKAIMHQRPDTREDTARAVLAGELVRERRRVLRRLERMGVLVVSAPPGQAPIKLLEKYVEIKRRGLLG